MLVIPRFSAPGPNFAAEARPVVDWWAARPGCLAMDLVRNLDDPDLYALVGRWASVGEYRRSFNGYEAKMILTEVLLLWTLFSVVANTASLPARLVAW